MSLEKDLQIEMLKDLVANLNKLVDTKDHLIELLNNRLEFYEKYGCEPKKEFIASKECLLCESLRTLSDIKNHHDTKVCMLSKEFFIDGDFPKTNKKRCSYFKHYLRED